MREHKSISIADQIFEQLEFDILSGKYPRGELLSELRLSAELGVSRTPVREAIRRLEQENLLEESSKGMVVVGISREDLMDMYEIRLLVESEAMRRAAERITDAQLRELRDIIELQRFYAEKNSGESTDQIRDLDTRFHELLYRSSGSKMYYNMLHSLHKKITKFRMASVSKQSRARQSIEEHEAIYDALCAHDGERAYEAAVRHMSNARARMAKMEF